MRSFMAENEHRSHLGYRMKYLTDVKVGELFRFFSSDRYVMLKKDVDNNTFHFAYFDLNRKRTVYCGPTYNGYVEVLCELDF